MSYPTLWARLVPVTYIGVRTIGSTHLPLLTTAALYSLLIEILTKMYQAMIHLSRLSFLGFLEQYQPRRQSPIDILLCFFSSSTHCRENAPRR